MYNVQFTYIWVIYHTERVHVTEEAGMHMEECVGSLYGDDCMILSLSPTTRFGGETHLKATKMTRMAIIGGRGKNYRGNIYSHSVQV